MAVLGRLKKVRLSRKRVIRLSLVLIVLILVGLGVHELDSPVHGKAVPVDTKVTAVRPKKAPVNPAQTVGSTYFSLALPPGYTVQQTVGAAVGNLYNQTLLKTSMDGSLIIAIAVKAMPDGGLAADSSYNLRLQQPQNYQLTQRTIHGEAVTLAANTTGDGVVAFWPHGSYLATVSVSSGLANGGGELGDEQATLSTLLAAWQWR